MSVVPAQNVAIRRRPLWPNRVILLALAGILFLTLYPFRFDFAPPGAHPWFPFFLRGWAKDAGPLNMFLNVLLFVPYGFGAAVSLRERGISEARVLGMTFGAGTLLSYMVEVAQFYIPQRDSGWEDILTNAAGSVLGCIFAVACGSAILRIASACEVSIARPLTPKRALVFCLFYLAFWFAVSVPLQTRANLAGWKTDYFLAVGNRVQARPTSAWKGEVSKLQIWDRAVPSASARLLTSGQPDNAGSPPPLVDYDFSGLAAFKDRQGFLSDLDWSSSSPAAASPPGAEFDGADWFVSRAPVSALVQHIARTNQFSLHIVCKPDQTDAIDGWLVSISGDATFGDIELRQMDDHLIFWFRNSISRRWHRVNWDHPEVFATRERRDILFTYDGMTLTAYIDGEEQRGNYEFGPGASLARLIGRGKAMELIGYGYIYLTLIFFPTGCLMGFALRPFPARSLAGVLIVLLGSIIPSILLEALLIHLSGRPFSIGNLVLSVTLVLGGCFWINADRIESNAAVATPGLRSS